MTDPQQDRHAPSPATRGSCLGATIFCVATWAVLIGYIAKACI